MRSIGVLALPLAGLLAFAGCSSSGPSGGGQSHVPHLARQSTSHSAPAPSSSPAPARPRHTSVAPAPSPAAQRFTVVLNPGHNGGDGAHPEEINRLVPMGYGERKPCETTGTETNAGYAEHAFNWDVALRVRRILVGAGVHVIMTRRTDTGVGPCVDRRAAIGNRPAVDAVVSIHADGALTSGHGFHVNQDSRRPDGATAAVARQSIELGRAIHAALERTSGLVPSTYIGRNGYYYRDDLAGLNLARRPATFLELGNMKNPGDARLQSSPAGRQRIAAAVAAGILGFLGE
jgi:N-acetylmuramoyl-L-alanine amidase